jgi:LAS superfamily LD-carboxypeptidase LdcB
MERSNIVGVAADKCCGFTELGMTNSAAKLGGQTVCAQILAPLQSLTHRAAQQGFELCVASGFRSFERQLVIWNAKAEGLRPVLDDQNRVINLASLDELQRVVAIMRYSALPGASRHHWGSDIDIYDRAALIKGASVQLLPSESAVGGSFYKFHQWLEVLLQRGDCEGFYRPYNVDRGGVAPEPWHFSYAPMAVNYQSSLTLQVLFDAIDSADISLKATILDNLPYLFQRFIALPPPPLT